MSKVLKTALPSGFASRMVQWQQTHGRHGLPWQGTRDPYRVWLSEIMLQQTQVSTVLDYYPRFLQHFPTVQDLARASQDAVLGLWSGLGYYSRARNLHRCAQDVVARFAGDFPSDPQDLQSLPGIGRSTAAAIAAFCFGQRAAILDGNVKRVLTRVLAYDSDLSVGANERALWDVAEQLLPRRDLQLSMPRYTQALMDLGATVCLPRRTDCLLCPVHGMCAGRKQGDPLKFPVKTRKIKRSSESWWLLQITNPQGQVWLEKRPEHGIWASLYSLPMLSRSEDVAPLIPADQVRVDVPAFVHVLTHKDLYLHAVQVDWTRSESPSAGSDGRWMSRSQWQSLGLPAPIRALLEKS
jgi:A/G-specific adenine glycosylase